jgi:hypothetical protein
MAQRIWEHVCTPLDGSQLDARARLRMFCDSLNFGLSVLAEQSEWLEVDQHPLDLEDAELILGPGVRALARFEYALEGESLEGTLSEEPVAVKTSPFFAEAQELDFGGQVEGLARGRDVFSAFDTVFEHLAKLVGATEPEKFRWAEKRRQEVMGDPYRRLRIGFTGPDLVALLQSVLQREPADEWRTRLQVSQLLDRFIDAGGVVPTTAVVKGRVYRIYRKGEADSRIEVGDRIQYAVSSYKKPISLTRLAKLTAALSFDDNDSLVEVRALERGNVPAFSGDLLDDGVDIPSWLRDTRRVFRPKSG